MLVLLLVLLAAGCRQGGDYEARGDIVAIDEPRLHVTIRHDDIPGVMGAMTMRFAVASPDVLTAITPGARVRFTLRRDGSALVVTHIVPDATTSVPASAPGPGVHDHTPHHGGIVGMSGQQLHLEALALPAGTVRLWLSDVWRSPLPAERASGAVTLELPDGDVELPLRPVGGALEAAGKPLEVPDVTAHFELTMDGAPLEMDFLLPVTSRGAGAAGVPMGGCVPLRDRPAGAGRLPRCTLDFGRPITAVTATPDGRTLLVGATDLGVSAWNLPGGDLAHGFAPPPPLSVPGPEGLRPHPESPGPILVSPDGREAVVVLEGRLLRHAIDSGALLAEIGGPRGVVRSAAWSPDGAALLVSVFYDRTAHLLQSADGRELRRLPVEREAAGVAFSAGSRLAAVGSELGAIALFTLVSDAEPRLLSGTGRAPRELLFAGDRLLSAADDGTLGIWDVERGTLVTTVAAAGVYPRLAPSRTGRFVASAGGTNVVLLHDAATGAVFARLAWHGSQVLALAWADRLLATGDVEGHLALWDVGDVER